MSYHCNISHWRESSRTQISTKKDMAQEQLGSGFGRDLEIFAKIFQAIGVQLCPLLCFLFVSKSGDVSQEPEGGGEPSSGAGGDHGRGWLWSGEVSARLWVLQGRAAMNPPWCSQWGEGRWQRNQPVSLGTHGHHDGAAQPLRSPSSHHLEGAAQTPAGSHRSGISSWRSWILCLASHCNNGLSCYKTLSNTCVWTLTWPFFEDRKRKYLLSHNTC